MPEGPDMPATMRERSLQICPGGSRFYRADEDSPRNTDSYMENPSEGDAAHMFYFVLLEPDSNKSVYSQSNTPQAKHLPATRLICDHVYLSTAGLEIAKSAQSDI